MNAIQTNGIESCNWQGVDYVAVYVSPRGFANESSVYVVRAEDADGVARLQAKVDRASNRQPGDGRIAYWMSSKAIAQHIHGARASDGAIYLLTLDADGNQDSIVL
jgi:hypothetical protein